MKSFVNTAFSTVWVAGEVHRPRQSQRGHLYFELVEKGRRDEILGKLEAVIWRRDYSRVRRQLEAAGETIREGQTLRCRGQVDFFVAGGRLQLVVREIDPLFAVGLLARRRQETLEALASGGLLERNKAVPLPRLPLDIGLITAAESAAYHDVVSTLQESGYGFRVEFVPTAVQGAGAARALVAALRTLARLRTPDGQCLAAIVVVRGGGGRSELATFDDRLLAETIARSPRPVLTGLGHETDESIADRVAHLAAKTPTRIAELIVQRVASSEDQLQAVGRRLAAGAQGPLLRGRESLARAERSGRVALLPLRLGSRRLQALGRLLAGLAGGRVGAAQPTLEGFSRRLETAGRRRLAADRTAEAELSRRLGELAEERLGRASEQIEVLARLCLQLGPERTLQRGFSITRNAAGEVVRRTAQLRAGETVSTELFEGRFESRVEGS